MEPRIPKRGNGWSLNREPKYVGGTRESRRRGSELAQRDAAGEKLFGSFQGNLKRYIHRIHAGKHHKKPRYGT